MPRCWALDWLFTLQTAWARESLLERGWEGIVYLRRVTAKARTIGARLVKRTLSLRSSSSSSHVGRASDASKEAGSIGATDDSFVLLAVGDGGIVEVDVVEISLLVRFFDMRFAALRT